MTRTKAYRFKLPEGQDKYDVEDQNDNWEKLDLELKRIYRKITTQSAMQLLWLCGILVIIYSWMKNIQLTYLFRILKQQEVG